MRNEKGFTLIELLVVVAIVGILAAIAIPQFAEYRTRAFNSNAVSDLRNSITAQEAAFVDNQAYLPCGNPTECQTNLPGFKASQTSAGPAMMPFTHVLDDAAGTAFTAQSKHIQGDETYEYESATGVLGAL